MFDIKKVGITIATLRKSMQYSQEKLAEMLCISPQAISKWENGHTLPETSLLPVLAQIFECTIDDILMPAYISDKKIDKEKLTVVDYQAEQIAKRVVNKIEISTKKKEYIGLSDDEISDIIQEAYFIKDFTVHRDKESRADGKISTRIKIVLPQKEIRLVQLIYHKRQDEFNGYAFLNGYIHELPKIYYIDNKKKLVLLDDLSENYFRGYDFSKKNQKGELLLENHKSILKSVANFHLAFWNKSDEFNKIGWLWQFESKENVLAWIYDSMEKPFKKYQKNEETGKIPSVWEGEFDGTPFRFENKITQEELGYFLKAIKYLKSEYPNYIDKRFNPVKNITVIHGDLHPGQLLVPKNGGEKIKFSSLQNVRQGLCTEDLAMLIALHIEPDKKKAEPLLKYYYNCLCEKIKEYSYRDFINDYKLSVAENMFFTVRLINRKIFDFNMRDKAIKAFKTFIIDN